MTPPFPRCLSPTLTPARRSRQKMETNAADEHAAIIAPVAAENLAKPSKPSATTKVWTAQMKV